jgi:DNA gyrase subunit B
MPEYSVDNIQILTAIEHVRLRPEMYVGNWRESINLMAFEATCIGLDEALQDNCNRIEVSMDEQDFVTVSQNGNGVSMEAAYDGRSNAQLLLTELFACRDMKKDKNAAKACGAGIVVITALSEYMEFRNYWQGEEWLIEFNRGSITKPFTSLGPTDKNGTLMRFKPDPEFWPNPRMDVPMLAQRFTSLAPCIESVDVVIETALPIPNRTEINL